MSVLSVVSSGQAAEDRAISRDEARKERQAEREAYEDRCADNAVALAKALEEVFFSSPGDPHRTAVMRDAATVLKKVGSYVREVE